MSRAEGKKAEKSYFPSRPHFGIEAVNQNQTFAAKPICMKNPSPIKVVKKFELSGELSLQHNDGVACSNFSIKYKTANVQMFTNCAAVRNKTQNIWSFTQASGVSQ